MGGSDWRKTDTHLRSQDGFASFNWRIKFLEHFPLTEQDSLLTLQAWDKDLIGRDELIGERQLDFHNSMMFAFQQKKRTKLMLRDTGKPGEERLGRVKNEKTDRFPIKLFNKNAKGELLERGTVIVSIELVPEALTLLMPNGHGRDEPNIDP